MPMSHFIKIPTFEGPLDLLLHLLREHELDIFTVDLFLVTCQYLDYLRFMEFRDLKEASAFLSVAAQLIYLKTGSLLPSQASLESQGDEEALSSEEDLRQRLLAYEQMRRAGLYLADLETRPSGISGTMASKLWSERFEGTLRPLKGDPYGLVILYEQLLTAVADRPLTPTVKAEKERLTLEKSMVLLKDILNSKKFFILQQWWGRSESRYELVAHVLGILQLSREGSIYLFQEEPFGPLWVCEKSLKVSELPIQNQEAMRDA